MSPGYGSPPGYGAPEPYEYPEQNCTITTVTETAETCTPAFETVCDDVTVIVKKIEDQSLCYPVTKTVCTESVDQVDNEICVYKYQARDIDTEAKTVTVEYVTECVTQIVTVCDPGRDY